MRYFTALLLLALLAGPASAQTDVLNKTHSDDFFTSRVAVELRDPKTATEVERINQLAMNWISDDNSAQVIVGLMQAVVQRRPDAYISLEMRRGIIEVSSILYDRTQDKQYRDTMLQAARAGIDKVIEIQTRIGQTPEYMMYLGCRFCDPFFRLDEPLQKNYLDYCKYLYRLHQDDKEITTVTRFNDCLAYGELSLYERNFSNAALCVSDSLKMLQSMPPAFRFSQDVTTGLSPAEQVLFLGIRTAIMSGDKQHEKAYLGQFENTLKGPRGKEYQHILDWTHQRAKNPRPKLIMAGDMPSTATLTKDGNTSSTAKRPKAGGSPTIASAIK